MTCIPPAAGRWLRPRVGRLLPPLLVALAVAMAAAVPPARAQQRPVAGAGLPPVVQAVAGIISFTRWPFLHDSVRLCLVEPAEGLDAFFVAPILVGSLPVRPRRVTLATGAFEECNAVFVGRLDLAERRLLLQKLQGLPVLTMGEASPGCVEMTMFCLRQDGPAVTFTTNIDMIARGGGVRLNPRVLQLGRRPVTP